MAPPKECSSRVYARVGLVGNPSDGMEGACVAVSVSNYFASVSMEEQEENQVEIVANAEHDPAVFTDIESLNLHLSKWGYYGGRRLLLATCSAFVEECRQRNFMIEPRGFKMSYTSNIPRHAGLAGSSAIITGALNCLLDWYELQDKFPMAERPTFVLNVEKEQLGITAGLMDRVAQVYGGAVYMNLRKKFMKNGVGKYEYLPADKLPNLWILYADQASGHSGKMHAPVWQRWREGDKEVLDAVKQLAELADTARERMVQNDRVTPDDLASLFNKNFKLRRQLYGDAALGSVNLDMVRTCIDVGAAAKFCGSGGSLLVCCPGGEDQVVQLIEKCEERRWTLEKVQVAEQTCESM